MLVKEYENFYWNSRHMNISIVDVQRGNGYVAIEESLSMDCLLNISSTVKRSCATSECSFSRHMLRHYSSQTIKFMEFIIAPIIKDRISDVSDLDNYLKLTWPLCCL